ncbi:MAG: OmpA family protein [bacterium]
MPRSSFGWLVTLAVLLMASGAPAQLADDIVNEIKGGGPVVGVDVGAALPISDFRRSADPGGSLAPFVGWQIGSGKGFTITPIIQGQFAGFSAGGEFGNGTPSITSAHGGMRFSLNNENTEIYLGAVGGYYWSTSGPSEHDNGNGFGISGGLNYALWQGGALGVFARYDQARIRPYPSDDNQETKFITTGLEVRQRFFGAEPPPPPPPVVAAAPPPPAPPVKKKIVLRGVNFDFNKSNIRPDAVPILDEAAKALKDAGEVSVAVNGYTDGIGSDAYNDKLSVRRAIAVRDYLEQQGVAANRLTAKGFGKSNPVASNETAEGRAQNRRVELIVNNP